jgi:hypothetical protein
MTAEEYERQYAGAQAALRDRGCKVGVPYRTHDGVRAIHIDNSPCVDSLVFERAWGTLIADSIVHELLESRSEAARWLLDWALDQKPKPETERRT